MDPHEIAFWSIEKLARLIEKKKVSPVELVEMLLRRIGQQNPRLNAFLTVTAERALSEARRTEKEIFGLRGRAHYRGLLHGIPVALKDNIWTRGIRTTAGSKILREFVPAQDATVVRRLQQAGAVLLGKTNLHEFAYGVTTNNPHFGPTRNPWDLTHIPGGSSGGSAAAVAAGLCFASVGSDTGGSIRIPAALCGIVGLKPTFGRVSCHGVVPLSASLDHVGPLARTVADAAILLRVIAGRDPYDASITAQRVPEYAAKLRKPVRGLRLGWPRDFFLDRVGDEIRRAIEQVAREFERLGATIEEVSLPRVAASGDAGNHIALVEARHYHESQGWFPARAADYGEDVRKRLQAGADVRAIDYLAALEVRKQVRQDFAAAFTRVDALLVPTTPIAAPAIDAAVAKIGAEEEPVRSALLRLNRPANFAGVPAISIPCGFTREHLPIGLQLIGPMWGEAQLLRIASAYERATEWHTQYPPGL
ncbi:MAG: Asp-tRNA(Asn)/Glu-tRNA(Gln) amidotransferase subunit GatA [Acidobacteria bacterium]|nr:Asp-tRNA(Asn)/Glu-tRNA(Gln) amidotransferase subunit GatA [Acidobacteriota bacterium]